GLDVDRFNREFHDNTYSTHVEEDIKSGNDSGVSKTPTFFINEDRYDGLWDLDSLLNALDEESVFSWREVNGANNA
ncbi:MAG: thioredoxin domain-containing protein, partial [Nitrososphaeraceae archaeon]